MLKGDFQFSDYIPVQVVHDNQPSGKTDCDSSDYLVVAKLWHDCQNINKQHRSS
jgi:hypothetical protein